MDEELKEEQARKNAQLERWVLKQNQRARRKARCPGCGEWVRRLSTQSHHLFRGRDVRFPQLDEAWNIVQVCGSCHMAEGSELQITAALMKIHEYGPDTLEQRIRGAPNFEAHGLPDHFLIALRLYEEGYTPEKYREWTT